MAGILSIVWFKIYPAAFGGQKNVSGFNEHLADHFIVDCICSERNKKVTSKCNIIPILPNSKTQFLNPASWKKIFSIFSPQKHQYIIFEFPYYGILINKFKKQKAFTIVHTHNIEAKRFKELKKWWWKILAMYEKQVLKSADLVLFINEEDRKYAIDNYDLKKEKTYILPYGIEQKPNHQKEYARKYLESKYGINPNEKILLFAGTLDYLPNAQAVGTIYNQLVSELKKQNLQFKIIICGRNKSKEFEYLKEYKDVHVIQAGFVENIDLYFEGADVFINPVQNIHGVQTKIFDAVANQLSIVIFNVASTGVPHYLINEKVFVAQNNNFSEFAQKVKEALSSSSPTPQNFYDEYNWSSIVDKFVKHLQQQ